MGAHCDERLGRGSCAVRDISAHRCNDWSGGARRSSALALLVCSAGTSLRRTGHHFVVFPAPTLRLSGHVRAVLCDVAMVAPQSGERAAHSFLEGIPDGRARTAGDADAVRGWDDAAAADRK